MTLNPLTAIRRTRRLLTIRSRGLEVLELAEQAEADPRLYRSESWWRKVVSAGARLVAVLPLPKASMSKLQNIWHKAGIVVGVGTVVVGALVDPQILALLPAKVAGGILSVAAILGAVSGLLHPTPTQATDQPQ